MQKVEPIDGSFLWFCVENDTLKCGFEIYQNINNYHIIHLCKNIRNNEKD